MQFDTRWLRLPSRLREQPSATATGASAADVESGTLQPISLGSSGSFSFERKDEEVPIVSGRYHRCMTYRISGLDPAPYRPLFNLPDALLADRGIVRMTVDRKPCFPCRVSLADREIGESVLLVNHVSNDVSNPYRASHAIFVGDGAGRAEFVDELPPVFAGRTLSLRAFDELGMMIEAILSDGSDADFVIRKLLGRREVETIHTHNAAQGCFLAKIERS